MNLEFGSVRLGRTNFDFLILFGIFLSFFWWFGSTESKKIHTPVDRQILWISSKGGSLLKFSSIAVATESQKFEKNPKKNYKIEIRSASILFALRRFVTINKKIKIELKSYLALEIKQKKTNNNWNCLFINKVWNYFFLSF